MLCARCVVPWIYRTARDIYQFTRGFYPCLTHAATRATVLDQLPPATARFKFIEMLALPSAGLRGTCRQPRLPWAEEATFPIGCERALPPLDVSKWRVRLRRELGGSCTGPESPAIEAQCNEADSGAWSLAEARNERQRPCKPAGWAALRAPGARMCLSAGRRACAAGIQRATHHGYLEELPRSEEEPRSGLTSFGSSATLRHGARNQCGSGGATACFRAQTQARHHQSEAPAFG